MKIEHIMTRDLIVVDVNSDIFEVAKTMKEKDIGIVPVSDNNTIIGVLTDRDIVVKILANNDDKIISYINKEIIKININSTIEDAINLMGDKKVKRLLVENNNKLVGIISLSDILGNLESDSVIKNIKKIFTIYRNTDEYITKINEFKL